MDFVYELLRAGTTSANSDTGSQVAQKINNNFKNVADKLSEIDESIKEAIKEEVQIGNMTTAGTVKSSNLENKVNISEDGTMEINSVNVSKLEQDNGDFIILDGNT